MTKNTSNSRLGEAESGDFGIPGAEKAYAPVFRFGLFTREKARAHDGTLMIILRCCHCAARYEHPKHANTTTLKTHSRVKHKDILSDLAKKAQHDIKTKIADYADTILNTDLLQGSKTDKRPATDQLQGLKTDNRPITDYSPAPKHRQQAKLVGKKQKRNFDPAVFQEMFIAALVDSDILLNFCDRPKVQALLKYAIPGLEKTVTRSQIEKTIKGIYNQEVSELKKILADTDGRFALSLDEWKASDRYKFLGIALSYHDEFFALRTHTIGVELLNHGQTSEEALMEKLSKVLADYDINGRIISITRNSDAPLNNLLEKFVEFSNGISHLPSSKGDVRCAGHILHLSSEAILQYTFFRDNNTRVFAEFMENTTRKFPGLKIKARRLRRLPKNIRKIVKETREGGLLERAFAELVVDRKSKENTKTGPEHLLLDNESQWLSTYQMLDRFLYFRKEIDILLSKVTAPDQRDRAVWCLDLMKISADEWDYLSSLREILHVYHEPTMNLQSSKRATIHMTIPYMWFLLEDLSAFVTESLKATNPWLSEGLLEARKTLDHGKGNNLIKSDSPSTMSAPDNDTHFGQSRFSRMVYKKCNDSAKDLDDEVTSYLNQPRETRQNLVEFYQGIRYASPVLYRIAKDYLAIPAVSLPTEPSSSLVGDIATKKRDRVLPEMTKVLAFLKLRGKLPGCEKNEGAREVNEGSKDEWEDEWADGLAEESAEEGAQGSSETADRANSAPAEPGFNDIDDAILGEIAQSINKEMGDGFD
ncbi:hypothetical protein HF325_000819 [Metschnikowia pulcherrima]|uniref:HAT C-terminal dimerisation domain-containing protein n=1 Tax=Metschnikowia pulcherrima TaxID=27326 RepID=A0A8H7GZ31_9ASCO|nr:hypothetical protein HF325_000819 [Metschnikowia pulcherrima]